MKFLEEINLLQDIIKIYSPSGKEKEVSDFLFNFLKNKKFEVEQDKEWNVISRIGSGAYTGYQELCKALGITPIDDSTLKKDSYPDFYGTTYSSSGFWLTPP